MMKLRCLSLLLGGIGLMLLGGCAGGAGSTLVPARHKLIPTAECLRDQSVGHRGLPRELSKTVLTDYQLEPGDGLLIEPELFDSAVRLPADQIILPDGTIDLGRYGRPRVAGRTIVATEQLIESAILAVDGDELEPEEMRINVRLIDPQSKQIYVLGEVVAPGSYPFIGRETVLDAIVAAGGLSDRAAACDIILTRPTAPGSCRIVLPICYHQIVQLGDTSTNYQLMPGDRIYVASRSILDCLNPFDHQECEHCCGEHCPCPSGVGFSPPTVYALPSAANEIRVDPPAAEVESIPVGAPAEASAWEL